MHDDVIADAGKFANDYLAPNAQAWEMNRSMPREMFVAAAGFDLCGLLAPVSQGGREITFSSFIDVVRILAKADFAATFALIVHNNHVRAIASAGSEVQVSRWLPDMIKGQKVGAFLLTEPGGGSDATALKTTASSDGSDFLITGEKAWVTNGTHADLLNVFAQTDPGSGARGIASFQIPIDATGVEPLPAYDMLGGYAMNAAGFRFSDVRVAADQVLVPAGKGFAAAMAGIDIARTVVAAMCCGLLETSLECVMPRLQDRQAFGKPLIEQQGLSWQAADVGTDLAAARLLAKEAARLIDAGESAVLAAAHAKKFATRVAFDGVSTCMQAMGADGLKQEFPFSRALAAAKIAHYIDGTTEIQNVVIARGMRRTYSEF
ncbi:MAG: acyl-CoA dehydrogenase family protein [Pseudomonadales bacterium]|nr:acyl-CoA dehydrogenase family protein [Pseudomonadales bacterium]